MNWLTEAIGVVSVVMNVHGAMEFSDDNRPKVTHEKHVSYQQKLKTVGKMDKLPNKLLNYNVMIDTTKVSGISIANNEHGAMYVVAEPKGWVQGKQAYYARMACDKSFKECVSLTNSFNN